MAKKKPVRKRRPKTSALRDPIVSQIASGITAEKCAAYSVMVFSGGNAGEEWQHRGVEAFSEFANLGWSIFHSAGGLNVDWEE